MNKLRNCFKRLLAPVLVLTLVAVLAVVSPLASVVSALRVNAAGVVDSGNTVLSITGLPSHYAQVGDPIKGPTNNSNVKLIHAGKNVINESEYKEVGQYEWQFYCTIGGKEYLYDTYTVWVSQPSYVITMPNAVPTSAPKDMDGGKIVLPLPSNYTKDGETIKADNVKLGTDNATAEYELTASASLNNVSVADDKISISKTGVTIDLSDKDANARLGNLQVTYYLRDDKAEDRVLTAKALNTIEIKNVEKANVKFNSNPSAPSVSSLAYYQTVTFNNPTPTDATYNDTTLSGIVGTTKIIGVKFYNKSTQPSNWDDVPTTSVENGAIDNANFTIKDGMKVTAKALGWYKFYFETNTLYGNTSANENDAENGKYWSDAVRVRSDNQSPTFKFVKDGYTITEDGKVKFSGATDAIDYDDVEDELISYYPFVNSISETEPTKNDQVITVNASSGISLPAVLPHDNATSFADLKVRMSVSQVRNSNWESVSNNTQFTATNGATAATTYNPKETYTINFADTSTVESGNKLVLKKVEGLYKISLIIEDKAPEYTGEATTTSSRQVTYVMYVYVSEKYNTEASASNSPTINNFQVNDVYRWEGDTFSFTVPTISDPHQSAGNLMVDYYLANNGKIVKLDKDNLSGNRMTVDMTALADTDFDFAKTFQICVVARNFNNLQSGTPNPDTFGFDEDGNLPAAGKGANGVSYGYAEFNIFAVNAVSTTPSIDVNIEGNESTVYKAGLPIHISDISVDWGTNNVVDGRVSVAAYQLKADGKRNAIAVVDNNNTDANLNNTISSVSFRRQSYSIKDWYFTPRTAGTYELVVTAKANASNTTHSKVAIITVDHRGDLVGMATDDSSSSAPDDTIVLGNSTQLKLFEYLGSDGVKQYKNKDRLVYEYDEETNTAESTAYGDYTITVQGVSDPYCLTGEKFTPNQAGTYTFAIDYFKEGQYADASGAKTAIFSTTYTVEVTAGDDGDNAKILVSEDYNSIGNKMANPNVNYADDELGTAKEPKYAITLPEFVRANFGGSTSFSVDRKLMQDNLEKNKNGGTYEYMYPAILIPNPNLVNVGENNETVEVIVTRQPNTILVSSNTKLDDGSNSEIAKFGDYWVFRPEGEFSSNGDDYLTNANPDKLANAVYEITYKTATTSLTYQLTFGNPIVGELNFGDHFLSYQKNGETAYINKANTNPVIDADSDGKRLVTINLKELTYAGNQEFSKYLAKGLKESTLATDNAAARTEEYLWKNASVTVYFEDATLVDSWQWESTQTVDDQDRTKTFDLSKGSGTYKVSVSLYNPYTGSSVRNSFEFTIDVTASNNNLDIGATVWGIILTILAIGLLAGVIFYFVKTARETKFLDAPKGPKAPKNNVKETKPAAPKTEEKVGEDKKEDAK